MLAVRRARPWAGKAESIVKVLVGVVGAMLTGPLLASWRPFRAWLEPKPCQQSTRKPVSNTSSALLPPPLPVPQAQAAQLEETKAALLARQEQLQEAASGSSGASQAPAAQQLVARTRELAVLQGLQVCMCLVFHHSVFCCMVVAACILSSSRSSLATTCILTAPLLPM
jgi:hypothetical protein